MRAAVWRKALVMFIVFGVVTAGAQLAMSTVCQAQDRSDGDHMSQMACPHSDRTAPDSCEPEVRGGTVTLHSHVFLVFGGYLVSPPHTR